MSLQQLPVSHRYGPVTVTGGTAQLGDQYVAVYHDGEHRRERQWERLLASLRFPEINARYNEIKDTQYETYEWVFKPPERGVNKRSSLPTWLKEEHGVFLIQGKAGSGKSTFMKFLFEHQQTKALLRVWSPGGSCLILFHSFWLVGTKLQHNLKGLLANLILQIAHVQPETVARNCANHLRKTSLSDWSEKELRKVLLDCSQGSGLSVCMFLDGFDEFDPDDDVERLLKLICDVEAASGNLWKFYISTRPIQYIVSRLEPAPTIRLHELTAIDIKKYATATLQEASRGASYQMGEIEALARIICDKADGVFLWVYYALRGVCRGLRIEDEHHILHRRIEALPSAIEDLYRQMWQTQNTDNAIHIEESQRLFRLGPFFPLPLFQVLVTFDAALRTEYLLLLQTLDEDRLESLCLGFSRKVSSRSAGLIECTLVKYPSPELRDTPCPLQRELTGSKYDIIVNKQSPWRNMKVQFIHRTVLDFLQGTSEGRSITGLIERPRTEPLRVLLEARLVCFIEGVYHLCTGQLVALSEQMNSLEHKDLDFIDVFDKTIVRLLRKRLGQVATDTAAWIQLSANEMTNDDRRWEAYDIRDFPGLIMSSTDSVLCVEYLLATRGSRWTPYYKGHLFLRVLIDVWPRNWDAAPSNKLKIMALLHDAGADLTTPQIFCCYGVYPIARSPIAEILCSLLPKILFTRTDQSSAPPEMSFWKVVADTYLRRTPTHEVITFVGQRDPATSFLPNFMYDQACLLITVDADDLRRAICSILDRTEQVHPRFEMEIAFLDLVKQVYVFKKLDPFQVSENISNGHRLKYYGIAQCTRAEGLHLTKLSINSSGKYAQTNKLTSEIANIDTSRLIPVGAAHCPTFPDIDLSLPRQSFTMLPLNPYQDIGPHNWWTEATKRYCGDSTYDQSD